MQKCNYCKQTVEADDTQCKYCEEEILPLEVQKWNFSKRFALIIFIFLGPFSLPLILSNPRFGENIKYKVAVVLSVLWIVLFSSIVYISNAYVKAYITS